MKFLPCFFLALLPLGLTAVAMPRADDAVESRQPVPEVLDALAPQGPLEGRGVAVDPQRRLPANAVIVDADRVLDINGFSRIERQIFGLTAYEGTPTLATPKGAKFLGDWGVESVGMPGTFGWVLPKDVKDMDAGAIENWFADPKGAAQLFFHYPGGDRYVYGKILPSVRSVGAEPWMYLLGNVPGHAMPHGTPTDNALWAKLAVEYVKLCKQADPQLKYVHICNEPNSVWFRDNKSGTDYAKLFKTAAGEIKKAFPDMQVGGPVLCWIPTAPSNKLWYTWDSYSRPLIDLAASELDFLDWHTYGEPAHVLEGEIHLVTAYAQTRHEKWLRNAITESNFDLKKEQWLDREQHFRLRVLPMIRQTLMLLRNPDKVFCRQVHDLSAIAGGWYKFWGAEKMRVTPMRELFAVCKPLRGTRLVTASPEKDLWVESTVDGTRLTVALANFSEKENAVPLTLRGVAREQILAVRGEVLDVASLRPAVSLTPNGVVILPSESLTVLVFDLAVQPNLSRKQERHEFFAKQIMLKTPDSSSLRLVFQVPGEFQTQAVSAALRLGLKGAGSKGNWQVKIAGEDLNIVRPGPFVEVPLSRVPQGSPIEAELIPVRKGDGDQPTFFSFASLVLDRQTPE